MTPPAATERPRVNEVVEPGRPRFVAGIGASAGGLESLERFFRNVAVDSGVAFIVVQHLSADHKSLMEELIARFTRIPVSDARDGEALVPDHIYLLSPGKEIEVHGSRLAVFQRDSERALAFPVDRMLSSLADSYGPHAIGVILSGSGSDGSRGVRRIEALGGLVMAEDPMLASFDGMPRATIDTGSAAAVMSAEALAQALVEHVQTGALPEGQEMAATEQIIGLLKRALNAEFDQYKRATIYRRSIRRARMAGLHGLEPYLERLEQDHAELRALHDDLLIGVTAFFRDPEWFALLGAEIDAVVTSPIEPARELRAWCAGCATGEEAYSIAILFDEAIRRTGVSRTFKVFATDIHGGALEVAGAGVFSRQKVANISEERLARCFLQRADGDFQVVPGIRQKIVFAKHDLLKDTPFTNLDVVACRNMLIYLTLPAQRRALASLSYGLRVGGTLFLGSSEAPGELTAHYDTLNETGRLYRKRVHSRGMHYRPEVPFRAVQGYGRHLEGGRSETRLLPIYDSLLERFMPPAFLVSEQRTLLDSYSGASKLLAVPERRPTGDFFELVPQGARSILTGLFVRAQREPGPATADGVPWPAPDGQTGIYLVQAERIQVRQGEPAYVVSLIERRPTDPEVQSRSPVDLERTTHLEQELSHARMTLQATVEELEASNEELQATNEELVASNEELQSVNEELHSVNEELHTVNAEHQHKIAELTELNRDISHLLESIDVATVYLDRDLKIRKYTPRAAAIFGLVEHDVGRYLASFNHQLHYSSLIDDVRSVRDGSPKVEKEVHGRDGRWYFVRLLPYRIDGGIEGVVVTLTDATALAAARERARQLSLIVESSADAIIGMDLDGRISSWNHAASRLYGYAAGEALGLSIMALVPASERGEMHDLLAQVGGGEERINLPTSGVAKSGATLEIAKTMSPVRDAQGNVVGISAIARDVRGQKDLERRLRESERRYEDLYNNAPDMYLSVDTRSGLVREYNQTFLRVTGYSPEQMRGMLLTDLYPASAQESGHEAMIRLREGKPLNELPLAIRKAGGDELQVTLSSTAMFGSEGAVVGARVVLRDVSARREAEVKLAQAARMREQFLAMVSHELRSPLHAIGAAFQIIDQPLASEEIRERSQKVVRRQVRQMIRLVDDLLDVSRITQGKLHLERAPLDFAVVARGAFDAMAPAYDAKGVRLVTEGFESELPMFGDPGRLAQVLANLLENSLRHTPPGRKVLVSCRRQHLACSMAVVDEGRGIAAEDLKTIFDMFVQARQGLARSEGGLGLGLTIAERIVTAHGGTITAHSGGAELGATFTVTLALDPRAVKRDPAPVQREGSLTMVLVEDQEDAREAMVEALSLQGHQVSAARDGEEGLALILERRPDLVLLDVGLPRMNGYEVASEVRKQIRDGITLVAMTGYGQPEDVRDARAAGFDYHLTKPLDQGRLESVLREVNHKRRGL